MASLRERFLAVKRREILESVKASILTGNAAGIQSQLRESRSLIGGPQVASTAARIIMGRVDGALEHPTASSEWLDLHHSLAPDTKPAVWFLLESLAQAVGCFAASAAFGESGFAAMERSRNVFTRFIGALHSRNLPGAIDAWSSRPSGSAPEWEDAGHYLWLWSGGKTGTPLWSLDSSWLSVVEGKPVTIVGPAPTGPTSAPVEESSLVCRVIAPGVVDWPATDIAQGRCDLAYANSKSTKWFVAEGKSSDLERFRYLSYRTSSGDALGLGHSRVAFHHKNLLPMPWDRTNMVPLAAWDLLHVPGARVSITGTTFFASRTAYTANDVRFDAERNQSTDQAGSTGIVFERCVSFSHHNIGAHLTFMANLAVARAVEFDREGSAVVAMSYRDYLAEIDEFYGIPKV
jgi:hypothetical protein